MFSRMSRRPAALVVLLALSAVASAQCVNGTNAALAFSGGQIVTFPSPPAGSVDGFGDFTLEAWVRIDPAAPAGWEEFLAKWGVGASYLFRITPSGALDFYGHFSGAFENFVGGSNLRNGAWHHCVITRSTPIFSMYVDGAQVGTWIGTANAMSASTSADLSIGGRHQAGSLSVNGSLAVDGHVDEVRIWNIHRTLGDVNATRFSVLTGSEPGLKAYWRLNDGAGQTVTNSATATGAALNGTLGVGSFAFIDDPTWSFGVTAPITQCNPGTGQANAATASLKVNGVGQLGVAGIFPVSIPTTGPAANRVTLTWSGPANAPLLLLAGAPAVNTLSLPCVGSLDLSLVGLTIPGDWFTSPFPLNYLFILDAAGKNESSFTVPASLLGSPWLSIQGAVFDAGCAGVPYKLTAAFTLS
ncbi:MAG TPA: LamG domain-containing protein [Planctomycetota bacterium]|nr:LamG domain-containing protein [Planctomycetota bacterium]